MNAQLTGDERIIVQGHCTAYSILNFCQYAFSDIIINTNRGTFAEFIVKSAMEYGGFCDQQPVKSDWEPFDLIGPIIPSTGVHSRIEVKSASIVQRWTKDEDEPVVNYKLSKIRFGIAPAKLPDETGDYPESADRQRNNDLYVFCFYKASRKSDNILDMSLWSFYVCPTNVLKRPMVSDRQKTISLTKINQLGIQPVRFEDLYSKILSVIQSF